MLEAQLHGKLSSKQENLEDILTSNVFGSFKYVPPEDGLGCLLRKAVNPLSKGTLDEAMSAIKKANYNFWKWLEVDGCIGCEPDVLIEIEHMDGNKTIALIEAKYLSGKSSEADESEKPHDQLAREWDNVLRLAKNRNAKPILIYVTADYCCPVQQIEESQDELTKKGKERGDIYWLSWRYLPGLFRNSRHLILIDLVTLMNERYQLSFYQGISFTEKYTLNWLFRVEPATFNWSFAPPSSEWSFVAEYIQIDWSDFISQPIEWRFKS